MFNITRAKIIIAIAVPFMAVLAVAPRASATAGAAFIANAPADVPYIAHGSTMVYNLDPNNEHWVNASLGVIATANPTINISGSGNGEFRQCNLYSINLSTNFTQHYIIWVGTKTGNYTVDIPLNIAAWSMLSITCNLGKAPSSGFSSIYGVRTTPLTVSD